MQIRELTLADDEFKSAFVEGKFVVDCVEIKLIQNGKKDPKTYAAPGYLLVTPDNGAEARLVCPRAEGESFDFVSLRRAAELRSGRMIPDSHYYRLEARDVAGNLWTHPAASIRFDESLVSITLTVNSDYVLCSMPSKSGEEWTDMVILEELAFPMNVLGEAKVIVRGKPSSRTVETASTGVAGDLSIVYDPGNGRPSSLKFSELYAAAVPGASLPEDFGDRLLESVRFATATMCWPVMRETVRGGVRTVELSKARPARGGGLINPPLNPRGNGEDFYNLIGRYYAHACAAGKGADMSPLSEKLGGLYTLQGVWLDTIALVVSVCIESMIKGELYDSLRPVDAKLAEQMEILRAAVSASSSEAVFQKRGLDQINKMGDVGVKQKLAVLAECGALNSADPGTWLNLRNKTAHGGLRVDPAEMQKLLDNVFRSVTIVYKLAFLEIGYAGRYTDFSKHGWPTQQFDAAGCWSAVASRSLPACDLKEPSGCSEDEIREFVELVASGGEVAQKGLTARVRQAKLLAFLRIGGKLVGVAGLKRPSKHHRNEVSTGAGAGLSEFAFSLELGWVYVAPAARGGKSLLLCQPLIEAAKGEGMFATARADNLAMLATLKKLGFEPSGRQWPSVLGAAELCLRIRAGTSPTVGEEQQI